MCIRDSSYASYGKVYDYLIGNKSGLLLIYTQAFRTLEMLVIGLGAANALVRPVSYTHLVPDWT